MKLKQHYCDPATNDLHSCNFNLFLYIKIVKHLRFDFSCAPSTVWCCKTTLTYRFLSLYAVSVCVIFSLCSHFFLRRSPKVYREIFYLCVKQEMSEPLLPAKGHQGLRKIKQKSDRKCQLRDNCTKLLLCRIEHKIAFLIFLVVAY